MPSAPTYTPEQAAAMEDLIKAIADCRAAGEDMATVMEMVNGGEFISSNLSRKPKTFD